MYRSLSTKIWLLLRYHALFLLTFLPSLLSMEAQEITRIAVLDYHKVLQEFPRQSEDLQRISDLKVGVEKEMNSLKGKLAELQQDLAEAEAGGNNDKVRRIQKEISKQRSYGKKYIASKNEEIQILQQQATNSSLNNNLQRVLPDIITQIAREQGYSMVFDKNSRDVLWWETSIDITSIVIQRLEKRLS